MYRRTPTQMIIYPSRTETECNAMCVVLTRHHVVAKFDVLMAKAMLGGWQLALLVFVRYEIMRMVCYENFTIHTSVLRCREKTEHMYSWTTIYSCV